MTVRALTCPNCNANITDFDKTTGSGTCPYCGSIVYDPEFPGADKQVVEVHVVNDAPPTPQPAQPVYNYVAAQPVVSSKDKQTSLLLCLFLGFFGVHRFYVGKVGTGILWLLTGGMLCIGWLVDLVSIATDRFTDSQGRPITLASGGHNVCSNCGNLVAISKLKCSSCGQVKRKWWQSWWGIVLIVYACCIVIYVIEKIAGA